MKTDLQQEVLQLTSRTYKPYSRLDDLLSAFLREAINKSCAQKGAITLKDFAPNNTSQGVEVRVNVASNGYATDHIQEQQPSDEALGIGKASLRQSSPHMDHLSYNPYAPSQSQQSQDTHQTPINYQNHSIGSMVASHVRSSPRTTGHETFLSLFAREMAFYVKRYESSELARKKFGKDLLLVGASKPIRRIDQFIERASNVNLPVIISGEFGSEKSQVATSIHFSGQRREMPFIEVNCRALCSRSFEKEMENRISLVKDGTLYLNGIDELELSLQHQLPSFLESRLGQWIGGSSSNIGSPRLIASTNQDLIEMTQKETFCRNLMAELDFLKIHIPGIRNRREDIPNLLDYTLQKYRRSQEQAFAPEVVEVCTSYEWPENTFELERTVARLTAMSEKEQIGLHDVTTYAPNLLKNQKTQITSPNTNFEGSETKPEISVDSLTIDLVSGDFSKLSNFHNGVERALQFMGEHFQEEMSLGQLSEEAFVSASHLSYLFKTEVGVPFKTFLARLRIEKAKRILEEAPDTRITDVSLESGFGDLSHFERTFKKIVGCSPKSYRETSRNSP